MNAYHDKSNISAYKYNESVSDTIADICRPLSELFGTTLFSYTKSFLDGRLFYIANQLDFSKLNFQFLLQEDTDPFSWKMLSSLQSAKTSQQITPLISRGLYSPPLAA